MRQSLRMGDLELLAVFYLDEQRYALPLNQVERVVPAVEVTCLPKAPAIVFGVINVNGHVLPVLNIRSRFQLTEREIGVDDHFLIARTKTRRVVFQVDQAEGVIQVPAVNLISAGQISPGTKHVRGVAKLADGLVLIHDIDSFLSLAEEQELDKALCGETAGEP